MSRAQGDTPVNHSTAAWSPEVQREIKGLQTANRILAERVVELEELVDQLRHGLEEQGSEDEAEFEAEDDRGGFEVVIPSTSGDDHRTRRQESLQRSDNDSARGASSTPFASPKPDAVNTNESPKTAFKSHSSALENYSRHLPAIDLTKTGEEFFADLLEKRIIAGYDQERYSCWCHVAKAAKNPNTCLLSIAHGNVRGTSKFKQYRTFRWYQHAAKCAFYRDPWATRGRDGTGERLFPQFPLQTLYSQDESAKQDSRNKSSEGPRRGKQRKHWLSPPRIGTKSKSR
ncbi:hypothetical protein NliqN6_2309 [Naganishia liquefaciens]|uniref:Uncharacterized protein n=1 Tax=Naganishia liquefaciens TaxID=104408 RepID=A0A8H3TRJ1_9TREE|nr:hypothetical protein NliqN6_2309 [Naganishia liquefaciens]